MILPQEVSNIVSKNDVQTPCSGIFKARVHTLRNVAFKVRVLAYFKMATRQSIVEVVYLD